MAKNYKRHSQGKGFRRSDFGDMGLRAFREQQETIINSLKLQNKEFESTRKEFIDADILKSIKEENNRKELKKLEDNVFDVKFENTQIRADQEIDVLEHQAREKEREAKFWTDFSTTYAKQYADAAKNIWGAVELQRYQHISNQLESDPDYLDKLKDTEIAWIMQGSDIEKWSTLNRKEKSKLIKDRLELLEELNKDQAHESDIQKRIYGVRRRVVVDKLIEQYEGVKEATFRQIKEKGGNIDKNNVRDILEIRAIEALEAEGIPINSGEGRRFMQFMRGKGLDEHVFRTKTDRVQNDANTITGTIDELLALKREGGDKVKWELTFNRFLREIDVQMLYDKESGKFGVPVKNQRQVLLAAAELLADRGVITNTHEMEDFVLDIAHPGQKTIGEILNGQIETYKKTGEYKDPRTTWGEKHLDTGLRHDLQLILSERNSAQNSQRNKLNAQVDIDGVDFIKDGIRNGTIDTTDKDQMEKLKREYNSFSKYGTGKTIDYLNQLEVFNGVGRTEERGRILNTQIIENLAKEGQLKQFREYIDLLPNKTEEQKKIKNEFVVMLNSLEKLEQVGWDREGIRKWVTSELNKIQQQESTQKIKAGSFDLVIEAAIQDVYYEAALHDDDDIGAEALRAKIIESILAKMSVDDHTKATGLYRRDSNDKGTNTSWLNFDPDPASGAKVVTENELLGYLNSKGLDHFYLELGNENKTIDKKAFEIQLDNGQTRSIISRDDIDIIERDLLRGSSVQIPAIVNTLWSNQQYSFGGTYGYKEDQHKTKTQILNELLKASGSKVIVPEGEPDWKQWLAKNSLANMPENFNRLNERDQSILGSTAMYFLDENNNWPIPDDIKDGSALEKYSSLYDYDYVGHHKEAIKNDQVEEVMSLDHPDAVKEYGAGFVSTAQAAVRHGRLSEKNAIAFTRALHGSTKGLYGGEGFGGNYPNKRVLFKKVMKRMKVENPEAYKIYNNPNATDAELKLAAQYFDGPIYELPPKYGISKTNLGHSLL